MFEGCMDVIKTGDELGNGMIARFLLPSGREIFGFGTKTIVTGGWALGPTWCYFVRSTPSFLLDCGWQEWGGRNLLKMMAGIDIGVKEIDTILISHGHEDHDGGLSEIIEDTGLKALAHPSYKPLIRCYPDIAPPEARADFPAGCWDCPMPPDHAEQYCLAYHNERARLHAHIGEINRFGEPLFDDIIIHHLPGHSPDSIAVQIGEEAILVGDTILPGITPYPSLESFYTKTQGIIGHLYQRADRIYGLRVYIRSLKKLLEIERKYPKMIVLPSHRLFYMNSWNELSLRGRAEELIEHHVQRCANLLSLLQKKPKTAKEMALEYFEPRLLKGHGIYMAIREVISHCELLSVSGDVILENDKFVRTGTTGFASLINDLQPLA
ncbi:MAG: MBL fold metallo-hydrolase [Smithellaceae bacterium]